MFFLDYLSQYILFLGLPMFPKKFFLFFILVSQNLQTLHLIQISLSSFTSQSKSTLSSFSHFLTIIRFVSFDIFVLIWNVISVLIWYYHIMLMHQN